MLKYYIISFKQFIYLSNYSGISGNNAIKIVEKIGIALYNSKGFPSCTIDGEGVFLLPGKAQVISGWYLCNFKLYY